MRQDDEISYHKKRDIQSFRRKKPSEEAPYDLNDLADGIFEVLTRPLDKAHRVMLHFRFNRSIKETCRICNISRSVFYDYVNELAKKYDFPLPNRRQTK